MRQKEQIDRLNQQIAQVTSLKPNDEQAPAERKPRSQIEKLAILQRLQPGRDDQNCFRVNLLFQVHGMDGRGLLKQQYDQMGALLDEEMPDVIDRVRTNRQSDQLRTESLRLKE